MSFRSFLEELEQAEGIEHVKGKISPEYGIAARLENSDNTLLFEDVDGHEMKVVGNVYGSREKIAKGLGIEQNGLMDLMRGSLSNPREPELSQEGPVQEVVEEEVDLGKFPILKHFENDGGPYVTSSILVAKDSEGNRNLSYHRMQLIDRDKFAVRLVPRDLYKIFKEFERRGESLEVAAILGVGPAVALAAASSPPYEVDEYGIAGSLLKDLELIQCRGVELEVPSSAEIVFEGRLLAGERSPEGPFADITGTYDSVRRQPVFEVEVVEMREDAIYHAILPASQEHRLLMGMPREPLIFEGVDGFADIKEVALTPGGCGWLHAVLSIYKEEPEGGKRAIEASFKAHPSLKHAVVVDDDIDVHSPGEVEWAIATRARADRDVIIKSDVKGSSLDPTGDPETRLGSKMGIDATKSLKDPEKFERARIPDESGG